MKGKVIKAVIIILILLLGLIQILPDRTEAQTPPTIAIIFNEASCEVDVRPGHSGKGTITGRVISDEPTRDIIVKLVAGTDQGWPCKVDPDELIISPKSEESFTVEVAVPVETSHYTTGILDLEGSYGYYPTYAVYTLAPVTAAIKVKQYSRYSIQMCDSFVKTQPGATETFKLKINNMGNARETYNIEIIEFDKLDKLGFTATVSVKKMDVNEKDSAAFQVKVTVPKGIDVLGTHKINIQVTPDNMEVDEAEAAVFSLSVKISEEQIVYTTEFQVIIVIIFVAIIVSVFFIIRRRRKNKLKN